MTFYTTPHMGANIMDVIAVDTKTLQRKVVLLVVATAVALYLLTPENKVKEKKPMASIKTTKVLFKDGTEGRGVKLTMKNRFNVITWIGTDHVNTKKDDDNVRFYQNGGRQIRVAYIGDTIVKTSDGFTVVRAEQLERYIKI